jgi:hypothetical protein
MEANMSNLEKVSSLLESTNRPGITKLIEYLANSDFFTAPASTKFHGNFLGGLATHSYMVYKIYSKLVKDFNRNIPSDSIIIGGLLHDFCKVNFYKTTEKWKKGTSKKWDSYNGFNIEDAEPLGHGSKSVILLSKYITLTDFEIYSILYHMGLPDGYNDKLSFNAALIKYPDIIYLHLADFLSTSVYEKVEN